MTKEYVPPATKAFGVFFRTPRSAVGMNAALEHIAHICEAAPAYGATMADDAEGFPALFLSDMESRATIMRCATERAYNAKPRDYAALDRLSALSRVRAQRVLTEAETSVALAAVAERFASGEWQLLPAYIADVLTRYPVPDSDTRAADYHAARASLHPSKSRPGLLAYARTMADLVDWRFVAVPANRALSACAHDVPSHIIADAAERYDVECLAESPRYTLKISRRRSVIEDVYTDRAHCASGSHYASCMRHDAEYFGTDSHPTVAFLRDVPDNAPVMDDELAIAYLIDHEADSDDDEGGRDICARAIVRPATKQYVRIYGFTETDKRALQAFLARDGYICRLEAFDGARFWPIPVDALGTDDGGQHYHMPYVDGWARSLCAKRGAPADAPEWRLFRDVPDRREWCFLLNCDETGGHAFIEDGLPRCAVTSVPLTDANTYQGDDVQGYEPGTLSLDAVRSRFFRCAITGMLARTDYRVRAVTPSILEQMEADGAGFADLDRYAVDASMYDGYAYRCELTRTYVLADGASAPAEPRRIQMQLGYPLDRRRGVMEWTDAGFSVLPLSDRSAGSRLAAEMLGRGYYVAVFLSDTGAE